MEHDYPIITSSDASNEFSHVTNSVDREGKTVLISSHSRLVVAIIPITELKVLEWVRSILDGDVPAPISHGQFASGHAAAEDLWNREASDKDRAERKTALQKKRTQFIKKGNRIS